MANRIFLTNLGKYNEGELVGKWVDLPCADFEAELESIGVSSEPDENGNYYEEYFVSDYETDVEGWVIGEYADLDEINDLAESLEEFDEYELQAVGAFMQNGDDLQDAIDHVRDGDYRVYTDCHTMEDVAYEVVDACCYLDGVPENVANYFDYEAFGRDLDIEGTFLYMGSGVYIELIY